MRIRSFAARLPYQIVVAAGLSLSTVAMAADSSPVVKVAVKHAEWTNCGKTSGIKMTLQVELANVSQEPLLIGRINVAQERVYRKDDKDRLELLETTNAPDEFIPLDILHPIAPFADIQEQSLAKNASKIVAITHYAYLSSSHIQIDGNTAEILASFHITNVRRDGSGSDYWSDPVKLTLPRNCQL
jgi:hypothetical protein